MAISPCNTLNVKTLRISQLASSPTINSNDLLMISHYDSANNVYYSKKTTVGDLSLYVSHTGAFTGSFTGSFKGKASGSFSGSHYGSLISKNTKASGSFSGSHYGSLISKNTKASGSFSGSFYGSLLSNNTKFTGSFTGSFKGKASGSFSGSHYGSLISKNTKASGSFSGSHYGSLISKNTKASGSFSGSFYGSATFTLTSSYLKQTLVDKTNTIGYYNGTKLASSYIFQEQTTQGQFNLTLSSSLPQTQTNLFIVNKNTGPYSTAGVYFENKNRNKIYPNVDSWYLYSTQSGSLEFSMPTGSYQIKNAGITSRTKNTAGSTIPLKQIRNGFYFWPYVNNESISRDGAIGIGVQPPNEPTGSADKYLAAKLHIRMFSGSGAQLTAGNWVGSTPTGVNQSTANDVAILVQYGSGSALTKTFFVSGSGKSYMGGDLHVNGTLTATVKSFSIEHPDPSKEIGWLLRHSTVECPTGGDNIYRYNITTTSENLQYTISLPDYYKHLNENSQVWVNATNCFGIGYGTINEELTQVTINTNTAGNYNVLMVGTRKDKLAKDYWDTNGVEYFDPGNMKFQNRIKK